MPLQPLSHHDILDRGGPVLRSGRQLDLAASKREERLLVFKHVQRAGAAPDDPELLDTLQPHLFMSNTPPRGAGWTCGVPFRC